MEEALVTRYSRQMLLPWMGMEGQLVLANSRVVIIGAGGLGASAIMYLAGAGIGYMKIVDCDVVEENNLHRQIIHTVDGAQSCVNKAVSACDRINKLNPSIQCSAITQRVTHETVEDIISDCDVCVDATDNYMSRYIINDACVLHNKVLISGSAIGIDGQITVIVPQASPCYRCIYPKPSLLDSCRSCSNAGVLGPVPGLIGCLQAIETIKMLQRLNNNKRNLPDSIVGKQVFYDGSSGEFHTFSLCERNTEACAVCSANPTIRNITDANNNLESIKESLFNKPVILDKMYNIEAVDYARICSKPDQHHVLLDVRSYSQYSMVSLRRYQGHSKPTVPCSVSPSIVVENIPLVELLGGNNQNTFAQDKILQKLNELRLKGNTSGTPADTYVICRRGVDSISATQFLIDHGFTNVFNIRGGLTAWKEHVDQLFPLY